MPPVAFPRPWRRRSPGDQEVDYSEVAQGIVSLVMTSGHRAEKRITARDEGRIDLGRETDPLAAFDRDRIPVLGLERFAEPQY
jgi:hypothetical protein